MKPPTPSSLFFVHIPKTAGTSIEYTYPEYKWGSLAPNSYPVRPIEDDDTQEQSSALLPEDNSVSTFNFNHSLHNVPVYARRHDSHCPVSDNARGRRIPSGRPNNTLDAFGNGCVYWHEHDPNVNVPDKNMDTFCVIRNPIDRLISHYVSTHIDLKWTKYPDPYGVILRDLSEPVFNKCIECWSNQKSLIHKEDNHLCPQHYFAAQCTYALLFDNLENQLNELVAKYNITPRKLLHRNNSSERHRHSLSRGSINENNMEWINTYYKEDFELYDDLKNKDNNLYVLKEYNVN